jgi:hypothetical protein
MPRVSPRTWSHAVCGLALLTSCTHGLLSSVPLPSNERPVVRIETRGGVEYGVTTEDGILCLGRTATEGPCRLLYFLGETPLEEDGTIVPFGGLYYRVDMDLKHQQARFIERPLLPDDALVALVLEARAVREVGVRRTDAPDVEGPALEWPGEDLPVGTGIFTRDRRTDAYRFVGLVSGTLAMGDSRYVLFTGPDAMREALLAPRTFPKRYQVKYRPDDISVLK